MWNNLAPADAVPEAADAESVRRLRNVLEGEVTNILRCSLPELRNVPRDAVYDRIMDNPPLLHRAFRHFRTNPHLFAGVASPHDEDTELGCGRSLRQAIALIVRAAAKRHFRRHFIRALYRGPLGRLRLRGYLWFGLGKGSRQDAKRRAYRHFNALREYLLYEWQVRLFSAYAALPVEAVERLGVEILAYRDEEQLRYAAADAASRPAVAVAAPPATEARRRKLWGTPEAVVGRSRRPPRQEDILDVAESGELARLLVEVAPPVRKALAMEVAAVPGEVFTALEGGGLSQPEAIVFLLLATKALGRDGFAKTFIDEGGARRAQELSRRLGACVERRRLATVATRACAA